MTGRTAKGDRWGRVRLKGRLRRCWIAALLGCLGEVSAQSVQLPQAGAVFGQPFELAVFVADRDGQGFDSEFDPGQLLPLVVEELGRDRVSDGSARPGLRIRYRARAYQLGEVTLRLTPPQTLQVLSCLPEPPGELEWPSAGYELRSQGSRRWWPYALLALGLGLAFACWRRRDRDGAAALAADVDPAADRYEPEQMLAELLALPIPAAAEASEAFYLRIKVIVRLRCQQLCASTQQPALPAAARTSEELVATLPQAATALAPCLLACDQALFGAMARTPAEHGAVRDQAVVFVRGGGQAS